MRSLWKHSLVLAFGGFMLAVPSSSSAASADFWIAIGGAPQSITSPQGVTRYVAPLVGTNEDPANPYPAWTVYVTLQAKNPSSGFQCTVAGFKETRYKPAVTMPLRFQVFYPPPKRPGIQLPTVKLLAPVKYTVTATITKVTPTPSGDTLGNNKHEWTHELPGGGTPSCVKVQ